MSMAKLHHSSGITMVVDVSLRGLSACSCIIVRLKNLVKVPFLLAQLVSLTCT